MVSLNHRPIISIIFKYLPPTLASIQLVFGQAYIGGAFDFAQNRYGERRGKNNGI